MSPWAKIGKNISFSYIFGFGLFWISSPGPVHVLDSQHVTVCQILTGTTVLAIFLFCFIFLVLDWINDLYEVSIEFPNSSKYIWKGG